MVTKFLGMQTTINIYSYIKIFHVGNQGFITDDTRIYYGPSSEAIQVILHPYSPIP
jgi:hypothetical protein